jgi:hypothetical protein
MTDPDIPEVPDLLPAAAAISSRKGLDVPEIDITIQPSELATWDRVPSGTVSALDLLALTLGHNRGWHIEVHLANGTTLTAAPATTKEPTA